MPTPQPAGAESIVFEKKIVDGMFFTARGAGLVRVDPRSYPLLVEGAALAPVGCLEDRATGSERVHGHTARAVLKKNKTPREVRAWTSTTVVRTAVAAWESTPLTPTLAKRAVRAANPAKRSA